MKLFSIDHQPETLCLLPNSACFSFSWFPIKNHLMLIACELCHLINSGKFMVKEQEDILEKSDSNVVQD